MPRAAFGSSGFFTTVGILANTCSLLLPHSMFALLRMTQLADAPYGYISYGAGDFDGEGSGHDFYGVSPRLGSQDKR